MEFQNQPKTQIIWLASIILLIIGITVLHYATPTLKWQYHLIFMQSYFIPILMAAFQFGIKGGLGAAIAISILYFPHVMLQWGGLVETNLMRFMQIGLFNIIGFLTGLKAQQEQEEKQRYLEAARELDKSLKLLQAQSEKLKEIEEQMRLADRLAVIGELTASLAHEVRNPLGSIRGAVEILRDELPESQKSSEFFQILINETERLSAVVENFLTFSRRPRNMYSLRDLRETVRNVQLLLNYRARKKNVSLQIRLPDEPVMVPADANQLMHVLVNLAMNAVSVSPVGGRVEISLIPENSGAARQVHLSVSDQGPGISEAEMERIFQPFYTTREDGTGLGLAIVKRIADQNKWEIRVGHSQLGGAEFRLTLPLAGGE